MFVWSPSCLGFAATLPSPELRSADSKTAAHLSEHDPSGGIRELIHDSPDLHALLGIGMHVAAAHEDGQRVHLNQWADDSCCGKDESVQRVQPCCRRDIVLGLRVEEARFARRQRDCGDAFPRHSVGRTVRAQRCGE